MLTMESVDGSLRANGHPFQLKGVVWWGAESALGLPGGLERRSVDELLGLVQHYGFNAIKIPFLHQHVLFDEPIPATSFDHGRNPYLRDEGSGRPLKYIDALRVISRRAAGQGLLARARALIQTSSACVTLQCALIQTLPSTRTR